MSITVFSNISLANFCSSLIPKTTTKLFVSAVFLKSLITYFTCSSINLLPVLLFYSYYSCSSYSQFLQYQESCFLALGYLIELLFFSSRWSSRLLCCIMGHYLFILVHFVSHFLMLNFHFTRSKFPLNLCYLLFQLSSVYVKILFDFSVCSSSDFVPSFN